MGDSSIEPFDEAFEDTQSRRSIGESIKKILTTNPTNEKKNENFFVCNLKTKYSTYTINTWHLIWKEGPQKLKIKGQLCFLST